MLCCLHFVSSSMSCQSHLNLHLHLISISVLSHLRFTSIMIWLLYRVCGLYFICISMSCQSHFDLRLHFVSTPFLSYVHLISIMILLLYHCIVFFFLWVATLALALELGVWIFKQTQYSLMVTPTYYGAVYGRLHSQTLLGHMFVTSHCSSPQYFGPLSSMPSLSPWLTLASIVLTSRPSTCRGGHAAGRLRLWVADITRHRCRPHGFATKIIRATQTCPFTT